MFIILYSVGGAYEGNNWGLDQKFCPTVREINIQTGQIPSYSLTLPAWG